LYQESRHRINAKRTVTKIKERNFLLHTLIDLFEPSLVLDLGTKTGNSAIVSSFALQNSSCPNSDTQVITVDIDKFAAKNLRNSQFSIEFQAIDSVEFLERNTFDNSKVVIHSDSRPSNEHIRRELDAAINHISGSFLFIHDAKWSDANSNAHMRKSWEFILNERTDHPIYPGRSLSIAYYMPIRESSPI
jgi:cephalosporin hydroxylase